MIAYIKEKIKVLFEAGEIVHLSINDKKLQLNNVEVKIHAVYPAIFEIIECNVPNPKTHSIKYVEILTHAIQILELGELPEQPKLR